MPGTTASPASRCMRSSSPSVSSARHASKSSSGVRTSTDKPASRNTGSSPTEQPARRMSRRSVPGSRSRSSTRAIRSRRRTSSLSPIGRASKAAGALGSDTTRKGQSSSAALVNGAGSALDKPTRSDSSVSVEARPCTSTFAV